MPRYIITDFDGTFVNTNDVVRLIPDEAPISPPSDSPHLLELIASGEIKGVYGCTHKEEDTLLSYLAIRANNRMNDYQELDEGDFHALSLNSIVERLRLACANAATEYCGTSTAYDLNGFESGYEEVTRYERQLIEERQEEGFNQTARTIEIKALLAHLKIKQTGKNIQIQQILDDISRREAQNHEPVTVDFYDDTRYILDAINDQTINLPPNITLRLNLYFFSTHPMYSQAPAESRLLRTIVPAFVEPIASTAAIEPQEQEQKFYRWEPLNAQLRELEQKSTSLSQEAYEAAIRIHRKILRQMMHLSKNEINLETFKEEGLKILQDADPDIRILKAQEGWQNIIANIAIAITGVGLLAIASQSLYYGKLTLFRIRDCDAARAANGCLIAIEKLTTRTEAPAP